jgi:hypothetical protein
VTPALHYSTELLRIDGMTGDVQALIGLDRIGIDGAGWPLVTRPIDADAHARRERDLVAGMVLHDDRHPWLGGPSEGVRDVSVELDGRWPDTAVLVRFRHQCRPGLLLQRSLSVFDELGRPVPVELDMVGWRLDEWLSGGLAPPPRDAVDGLLEL